MVLSLSSARTRVLNLVDDDGTWFSEAEVAVALEVALDETIALYVQRGGAGLAQVLDASTSASGELDLSAVNPVGIYSVVHRQGMVSIPLVAALDSEVLVDIAGVVPLRVRFVARPTFPTLDADPIIYGPNAAATFPSMDQLICVKAAQHLKPKEGELNAALDRQEERLWLSVLGRGGQATVFDMPSDSSLDCIGAYYFYTLTGTSLQLHHKW